MKLFNFCIICCLAITLFFNYNVVLSHNFQNQLLTEFNNNNFTENTTASFGRIRMEFPNLTVTALPIKQLAAKYYYLSGEHEKAIKMIDEGSAANPYIKLGSTMKAEIYDNLKIKDSFLHYSRDAFEYSPNNSRHFFQYLKALTINDQDSLMIEAYNKIKNAGNFQYQRTFLASIMTLEKKTDTMLKLAKEAKRMYPNNNDIKLLADYVVYGQENILKSIESSDKAKTFYDEIMLEESLFYYKEAARFNPGDVTNLENIGLIYFQQSKYKKAIPYLKKVIDSSIRKNPINGKAELILGDTYLKLKNKDSGCYYLNISKALNNRAAFKLHAENCYN